MPQGSFAAPATRALLDNEVVGDHDDDAQNQQEEVHEGDAAAEEEELALNEGESDEVMLESEEDDEEDEQCCMQLQSRMFSSVKRTKLKIRFVFSVEYEKQLRL